MLVSVIIPILNEAKTLPGLLSHLQELCASDPEEAQGIELIFVDGGSSDDSIRRLEEAGFTCLTSERGRATQMNAGAAVARGSILLFLHADTIIDNTAIQAARSAIEAGAVGGFFGVRLTSTRPVLRVVGKMISLRSRLSGIASGDQAIFVTREAFDEISGYAALPLFEDIDLSSRLKRCGRFEGLDVSVMTSSRRWESAGTLPTVLRMWALRVLYYCGVSPVRLARYYGDAR
jgi:rSAM/selenodomain-associated transferase 2